MTQEQIDNLKKGDRIRPKDAHSVVTVDVVGSALRFVHVHYDSDNEGFNLSYDELLSFYVFVSSGEKSDPPKETINHPAHYGGDKPYEAIKVIEAWGLGFCLGNALKYIARADHKGSKLDDLKKAVWYLNREIERLEKEKT